MSIPTIPASGALAADLQTVHGTVRISSRIIAERFDKQHNHVIRDIRAIRAELEERGDASKIGCIPPAIVIRAELEEKEDEPNFEETLLSSFFDEHFELRMEPDFWGRNMPVYYLTREGFSLLAMGFTGRAALAWKIRYIRAFQAMEAALRDAAGSQAMQALREEHETAMQLQREFHQEDKKAAVQLIVNMPPSRRNLLKPAARYRRMGLTHREIGTLLNKNFRTTSQVLTTARKLGMLEDVRPVVSKRRVKAGETAKAIKAAAPTDAAQ